MTTHHKTLYLDNTSRQQTTWPAPLHPQWLEPGTCACAVPWFLSPSVAVPCSFHLPRHVTGRRQSSASDACCLTRSASSTTTRPQCAMTTYSWHKKSGLPLRKSFSCPLPNKWGTLYAPQVGSGEQPQPKFNLAVLSGIQRGQFVWHLEETVDDADETLTYPPYPLPLTPPKWRLSQYFWTKHINRVWLDGAV